MSKNLFRFIKKRAKKYAAESTKYQKVDNGEDGIMYVETEDKMAGVEIGDEDLDHGGEDSEDEEDFDESKKKKGIQRVATVEKKDARMVV
ncbi:hypothetical protein N9U05_00425 [bacterium]|jgi:hypothetical protein|nr:hypothetical protein [bacterium]